MKRTFKETVTFTTAPKDGQDDLAKRFDELKNRYEQLVFLLMLFAGGTLSALLLAVLFVSPWSAFVLLFPSAALGYYFYHLHS